MVIMDKEDYNNKAQELLAQPAYRSIPRDPTNKNKTTTNNKTKENEKGNQFR